MISKWNIAGILMKASVFSGRFHLQIRDLGSGLNPPHPPSSFPPSHLGPSGTYLPVIVHTIETFELEHFGPNKLF
jgi:hypothetical protein